MPGATDGRSREEPDGPQDQPQPLCRAASLSLCVLIQDPVDSLGPWLSGRKRICEQMKVFHEGMAGSSWRGRKAFSAHKKGWRWGRGSQLWLGPDSWLARRTPSGCHSGPECALSRVSYCTALPNIKCCANTKSRTANNFVMLKHSCPVINVLIVVI